MSSARHNQRTADGAPTIGSRSGRKEGARELPSTQRADRGRGLRAAAAVVALAEFVLAGCTGSPAHDPQTQAPGPRLSGSPQVPRTWAPSSATSAGAAAVQHGASVAGRPCVVGLPPAWQQLRDASQWWNATRHWIPGTPVPTSGPSPAPVAGLVVDRDHGAAATFELVGRHAQPTRILGTVARRSPGGTLGGEAADSQDIALLYQYGAGDSLQDSWTLYLWRRSSGHLVAVARNPTAPTGTALRGGFIQPVLSGDYLYWIQASVTPRTRVLGSELMQYDIARHITRIIYRGLVTAAGVDGDRVLFATGQQPAHRYAPPTRYTMRVADQATGRLLPALPGLRLGGDRPDLIVSNGDLVVWDTQAGGLRAWRPAWHRTRTLLPTLNGNAPRALADAASVRDLGLYRQFLTWDVGSQGDYVMDLRTDSLTQLTPHFGQVASAANLLQAWQYDTPGTNKNAALEGNYRYHEYVIDLATAPDLPTCGGSH